jgi:hypothetical protein
MNAVLASFFGVRQPRSFEGSVSEQLTYECARRLWLEAAHQLRTQPVIRPTLGANVTHQSRWAWLTS